MASIVLDGKSLARRSEEELALRVTALKQASGGVSPILATILVGDDPASATYVRMKGSACERIGMESLKVEMPQESTTEQLYEKIDALNENPNVHGILLQHPVPAQIDERYCFDAIDVSKDVDGVTCFGFGRMAMGVTAYGSATPQGIMRLLEAYELSVEGKSAVVIGRSPILGKPMAAMLTNANATVTTCHSKTTNLKEIVSRVDMVVATIGRPEYIKADWISDGAVVIDAGYHPGGVGDVELAPLAGRVHAYTPVPGGVGPMTINTLIYQTVHAAETKLLGSTWSPNTV